MKVQLYNFNTAGAQVRPRFFTPIPDAEAAGHSSETVLCISWNSGRCVAKSPRCRYRHACNKCDGDHRGRDCTRPSFGYNGKRAQSLQPEDGKHKKTSLIFYSFTDTPDLACLRCIESASPPWLDHRLDHC